MSEPTQPSPLAAIETLEAHAFRVGQVARRLLAEHSDHLHSVTNANAFGHDDHVGSGQIRLRAHSVDAVRELASLLGIEAETKTEPTLMTAYEYVYSATEIDGLTVEITAFRHFSIEETAALRAQQDQAPAEGTEGHV